MSSAVAPPIKRFHAVVDFFAMISRATYQYPTSHDDTNFLSQYILTEAHASLQAVKDAFGYQQRVLVISHSSSE